MEYIYNEHIAKRTLPKNLDENDLSLFEHELSKKIMATTINKIKDADILIDDIFSFNNLKFFSDDTHVNGLSNLGKLKRLLMFINSSADKINKGIWITDNWSTGYFHWLTDAIPRLIISEKIIDKHLVLLPREYKKIHFIKQSLDMLDIEVDFFDSKKRLHIKELLIPSHTAPSGSYNKKVINDVRNRFSSKNEIIPYKKIYISRQKAKKRKIVNESELISLLKSYNFEIHFFEDYNFYDQVKLMQQTTHLIGLHGAGLTNMLFMNKKSKILELRNNGDSHNNCYFSLASDLEHEYYYTLNEGNSKDTNAVDINVNLEKLIETIEKVIA